METVLGVLFIFLARTVDVSMATIRTIFTIRGKKYQAALIGFFEVIIYISALGLIVNNLDNILNLVAYGLGFSSGILVGSKLEEKLALGFVTVQVVLSLPHSELAIELRENGFGVTTFDGEGLEGPKKVLNVFAARRCLPQIIQMVRDHDHGAFITVMDARATLGGYIKMSKKK